MSYAMQPLTCPVFALVGGKFGYKYFIGYGAAWIA
jgi:hypothetical protein